jgi:hypothetical protein
LALDQFFHWIISLYAQTSEFDLEIGKKIDLQKQTKWWQSMIQICQIRVKTIWFSFALIFALLLLLLNVLA